MSPQETQIKALKTVILSQLLAEALDDIKGTTLYRSKVKMLSKQLHAQIAPLVKQNDAVYDENPTLVTNIYNKLDELVNTICKADMHTLIMLNEIYEHYGNNREDWDNIYHVQLRELQG